MIDVIKALEDLGYKTIDATYYERIRNWKAWYEGDVKSFHHYTVKTGASSTKMKRATLGMAKKVSEDWANLLMNERVKITLEGEKEQQFIDGVFAESNFAVKINEMQELKMALGTTAYIPRVTGQEVGADGAIAGTAEGIALDYVTAEHIYPLAWNNGTISEAAFDSTATVDGETYMYLQIHKRGESGYDIENRIYRVSDDQINEVPLSTVRGYERIPPLVHTHSDKRQFVIDRPNIANNVDYSVPLGLPIYANAIDVLKGVDIAYDSYCNEFLLGKKRVMVKPSAAEFLDGEPVFDPDDVAFYVLPEDIADGAIITPLDMSLRTAEHNMGIQDQLNLLSAKCGMGEKHYRFDNGAIATATQIVSENSELFRTVKKHEIILESALKELCRIILRLGNTAMNAGLDEDIEISIDFDDSIIEDKATEYARDLQMLGAGILNAWEFRARWMNEDESTAKAALPKMEDLTTEGQNEVE